ncbi:MAG: 16S rRNA (adenine(1518)-N(6)/adenine(1519)-N(6))-dimethyltransferase RsmA [Planctomycetota bacterium]
MAQTLREIRALLGAHGLRPNHKLGQNFLHDGAQMDKVIAAAGLSPGEAVLEVGPGTGALTGRLLEAGAKVVAVELDRGLAGLMRGAFEAEIDEGRLTLIEGDVLAGKRAVSPAVVEAVDAVRGGGSFQLVANLPYGCASPVLAILASEVPAMRGAVAMIQKEVADRLTAAPGGKAFGPLTAMVGAFCEVKRVAVVPPGSFWPAPKVHSAVVRLERRASPLTRDAAGLGAMLHRLFSKRRKQLKAILGADTAWPEGVSPTDRPERLSIAQLCVLAEGVGEGAAGDRSA